MRSETQGPLTEATFYILLALHRPLHGYGIMQLVDDLTGGRVDLGPGTLYGGLSTLVDKGWIRPVEGSRGRKKEYVISDAGRRAFETELRRLQELLSDGRRTLDGGSS